MSWNQTRYEQVFRKVSTDITSHQKTPKQYMETYKTMIEMEDYEAAKAITEVLLPLNYHTADTHPHIESLNIKKK